MRHSRTSAFPGNRLVMRVFVTGADGFIGSYLCRMMEGRGLSVYRCTRADCGDVGVISDWSARLVGMDAVVHLANTAHAYATEAELRQVNVEGTRRLAEQCARLGVKRFVYLSSVKVLGESSGDSPLDERATLAPEDAYGRTKAEAEEVLAQLRDLEVVVLRPPLAYGPGVQANFLRLLEAVDRGWPLPFASVRNRRSLIHVGNLADAIIRCLEVPQAGGGTWLVDDDAPVSTPELCLSIGAALGRRALLLPFPVALLKLAAPLQKVTGSLVMDSGAFRRDLGWRPPYSMEQGLAETASWWRDRTGTRRT